MFDKKVESSDSLESILPYHQESLKYFDNLYFESENKFFLAFDYQVIYKLLCDLKDSEFWVAKLLKSLFLYIENQHKIKTNLYF